MKGNCFLGHRIPYVGREGRSETESVSSARAYKEAGNLVGWIVATALRAPMTARRAWRCGLWSRWEVMDPVPDAKGQG